jgi:orotidine-5'-phosphate decarboxylase
MHKRRIVLPLDVSTLDEAASLSEKLADEVGVLKIGLELFTSIGPGVLRIGKDLGLDVFLDLKLHDIPETVERAVRSATKHGVKYLTVHASGGPEMLQRAVKAAGQDIIILAVTVLTSLNDDDLRSVGVSRPVKDQVPGLARMAWEAGVRGFVCSPLEVSMLRHSLGPEAFLVVPGIRPAGTDTGDQKRIATPTSAIRAGADLLVVGRPIRDAADPVAAARAIAAEIGLALPSVAA